MAGKRQHNRYCPLRNASGLSKARHVEPGLMMAGGAPYRMLNFHGCGQSVFIGYRDWDGTGWTTTFHRSRGAKEEITQCERCGKTYTPESVSSDIPFCLTEPTPEQYL